MRPTAGRTHDQATIMEKKGVFLKYGVETNHASLMVRRTPLIRQGRISVRRRECPRRHLYSRMHLDEWQSCTVHKKA
jgi:hypothetical protein